MEGLLGRLSQDFQHQRNLVCFAAQAEHQHGSKIGMPGMAPDGPLQHAEAFVVGRRAAARTMHDGNDAVDIGIVIKDAAFLYLSGNVLGHRRRAIHRSDDADIVAGANPAVLAAIPLKGGALCIRHHVGLAGRLAISIVALKISHRDIVYVDMLSRRDVG